MVVILCRSLSVSKLLEEQFCNVMSIFLNWSGLLLVLSSRDQFRILSLGSYDGIIGLDWLAKHSPMTTHWEHGWLSFTKDNHTVILHGEAHQDSPHTVVELWLMSECVGSGSEEQLPEIQKILADFSSVFAAPEGLPPVGNMTIISLLFLELVLFPSCLIE